LNTWFSWIFAVSATLIAVSVILSFAALSVSLLAGEFGLLLDQIPDDPSEDYKILVNLFGITAATATAAAGVVVALWTYKKTSEAARIAQRKQHTITILFETRLSDYFQTTNKLRKQVFPTDRDIYLEDWKKARSSADVTQREGADALQQVLNYYEFLAVGIYQEDLDKELLEKTIRGIMCNLVDDARIMISELRENDPHSLEHLATLYEEWRRKETTTNYAGAETERPIPSSRELAQLLSSR